MRVFLHAFPFILFGLLPAQSPTTVLPADTLATVGESVIRARDLIERIELMPWEGKEREAQMDSTKARALHSLMAEKLLALEAFRLGFGEDPSTLHMKKTLEKMFVKDQLYKREVVGRISLTEDDILNGLRRYSRELRVLAMAVRSEEAAKALAALLRQTPNLDSVVARVGSEFLLDRDTVTVNFGGVDLRFEEHAYGIGPDGISPPFLSSIYGWVVLQRLGSRPNPEYTKRSVADRRHVVETTLRRREEYRISGEVHAEVLRKRRAAADSALFHTVAEAFHAVVLADTAAHRRGGGYVLAPYAPGEVGTKLAGKLDQPLVRVDDEDMTLADVLEAFRYEQFQFESLDLNRFKVAFNNFLRSVMAGEFMAREGLQQNLQFSTQVRHDIAVWSDYWGARMLMRQILDTVHTTEQEVIEYLIAHGGLYGRDHEVNVREILVPGFGEAVSMIERIRAGEDMAELARRHSLRHEWAVNGGESGFFPVYLYSAVGFAAMMADIGELVGPVRDPRGFSVFTVLGRRTVDESSMPEPEVVRKSGRELVLGEKQEQALNRAVANLARKYGIRMNYGNLKSTQIIPHQMVTRRFIGFGGVMMAVPMLFPIPDWPKELERMREQVP
ncbi:MAG: peptidylprolyl isomerase [Bacteroidota bacterium]